MGILSNFYEHWCLQLEQKTLATKLMSSHEEALRDNALLIAHVLHMLRVSSA